MLKKLLTKNRSYRSFTRKKIQHKELIEMIECARLGGSSKNSQSVRYIPVSNDEIAEKIFPNTAWAGYIDWSPSSEERPSAYILLCMDKEVNIQEKSFYLDMGIAAQNILLRAVELGYGGCMLGAYNKKEIEKLLEVDTSKYESGILIALGEANQEIKLIESKGEDIKYYRDEKGIHYVPKRKIDDLVVGEFK